MQRVSLGAAEYHPFLDARQGPTLVIFTAPACGACRRLRAVLDDMPAPMEGLWVREVDAERAPGLVADLEIFHLPAMFLYMNGDFHAPVSAVLRAPELAAALCQAAAGPRMEPP